MRDQETEKIQSTAGPNEWALAGGPSVFDAGDAVDERPFWADAPGIMREGIMGLWRVGASIARVLRRVLNLNPPTVQPRPVRVKTVRRRRRRG